MAAFYNDLTSRIYFLLPDADIPTVVTVRRMYYKRYGMMVMDVVDTPERDWR